MDRHLPDLLDSAKDLTFGVQDVHRGGSGQLGVQAQSIMASLYRTFESTYKEVISVLRWRGSMRLSGFIARICGLKRTTGLTRVGILRRRNFVPKRLRNCGGRKGGKRKRDGVASCSDRELPDILSAAGHPSLLPQLFYEDDNDDMDGHAERPAQQDALCGAKDSSNCRAIKGCLWPRVSLPDGLTKDPSGLL